MNISMKTVGKPMKERKRDGERLRQGGGRRGRKERWKEERKEGLRDRGENIIFLFVAENKKTSDSLLNHPDKSILNNLEFIKN